MERSGQEGVDGEVIEDRRGSTRFGFEPEGKDEEGHRPSRKGVMGV